MPMDFSNAGEQRTNDLIPDGSVVTVHMTVRPGNSGEGGWLKRSKAGDSEALDCEFTVVDGPHAKRKFWSLFTVQGTSEGHQKAADISSTRLRAILESVQGIKPDDESPAAKQARKVNTWGDFDGLRFLVKVGIEKGKDGYKDKNSLAEVITPDRKAWTRVDQVARQTVASIAPAAAAQAAKGGAAQKPSWAS